VRHVLPAGTTFRVLRVRRCTHCLGEEKVERVVTPPGANQCGRAPVTMQYGLLPEQ